jgi:pimeloyl-ACP methyl ester carboxylesterase
LAIAASAALGCAQGPDPHTVRAEGASKPIAWTSCPSDFARECAWVPLPLDYDDASGKTLPIFVSHYPAKNEPATAQLWLLNGGPGDTGNAFTGLIPRTFAGLLPDVEFYVLEQRGVGESARLGCAEQESASSQSGAEISDDEWPACIDALKMQWGEALAHFNTTADARDLGNLIARTREPNKRILIYGMSYGTTRALRFLQIHPDEVDGVILDSVLAPGLTFHSHFDEQYDPVAKDLAKLCAADAECGARLGPDPWAKVSALLEELEQGHCPNFQLRSLFRSTADRIIGVRQIRGYLFPLAYRLERCEPQDVMVVEHFLTKINTDLTRPPDNARRSPALQRHVSFSELWEEPAPSQSELDQRCASQTICPEMTNTIGRQFENWPRYPHDRYVNQWPTSQTPLLAMHGTLDVQTPLSAARSVEEHFTAPHQQFVEVAFSGHLVLINSPVKTPGAPMCGAQLLQSFVTDPGGELDTSCLEDLAPVSFAAMPDYLQDVFGATNLWDNPPRP